MIAPRARLLIAFVALAWPALTVASLYPAAAVFCAIFVAAFVLLTAGDALLSRGRLRSLAVRAPELVRLAKNREGAIDIRLTNESKTALSVRVAPALPAEFTMASEDTSSELPPSRATTLSFPCTPSQRGRYTLETLVS